MSNSPLPISNLPNVQSTGLTPNDLLVVVNYDLPSGTTKNITTDEFKTYITSGITNSFTGGTISGSTEFTDGLTANTLNVNGVNITGDTYVTGGTYYTGGTIIFDYNTVGNFQVTGLTEDLNNAIAGLAETDELTIELDVLTNKIRLKDIVAPGSGGTRTFQGDTVIESGLTATTAFVTSTQWTLDFMDSLNIQIYAPNELSIDSKVALDSFVQFVLLPEIAPLSLGSFFYLYLSDANTPSHNIQCASI
jgi:hypothetical protein